MTSIYTRTAEQKYDPATMAFETTIGKTIIEYLNIDPYKGVAVPGQDHPQVREHKWQDVAILGYMLTGAKLYFHRPIHELFSTFFGAGLVMDGLEEPCFKKEDGDPRRMLSTSNFVQLPPILGFRLRLMGN
jgi:hypothetical protein